MKTGKSKPMPKLPKPAPPNSPWDSQVRLLAWLATCISVLFFLFYYRRGEVLLYGDAIAHINIARRVFDSKTPGLLQLGTVWLPLPHLLMIPFLISREMWQRGLGGSIPSMAAYVFSVIGIFRLTRGVLAPAPATIAAWAAALIYALNPNLIYMQATAMGETLYLAFFLWSIAYFTESLRGDPKALNKCGLCLAAACLIRYDGWFLAVAMSGIVLLRALLTSATPSKAQPYRPSRASAIKFVFIAAAAPALWLAYNGVVYRNPLEFANGPYSAKAIERRTQTPSHPGHPGSGNPLLAGMYFLKSAEANVAENEALQRTWILLSVAAALAAAMTFRRREGIKPALFRSDPPGLSLSLSASPHPVLRAICGATAAFPSSSRVGGRSRTTTSVTDCSCSPPLLWRSRSSCISRCVPKS